MLSAVISSEHSYPAMPLAQRDLFHHAVSGDLTGDDPGDVSIQLFDVNIAFDGKPCGTIVASVISTTTKVHALLNASERSLLNASIQLDTGL